MNVDLSGPHRTEGAEDQDIWKPRYFMVCSYVFPVFKDSFEGAEDALIAGPSDERVDDVVDEGMGVGPILDVGWEDPEEADPDCELSAAALRKAKADNAKWQELAEKYKEAPHSIVEIPLVEILPSKSVPSMISALNRFYAKLRSWGLPIYRLHSDRAQELTHPQVSEWAAHRGICKRARRETDRPLEAFDSCTVAFKF